MRFTTGQHIGRYVIESLLGEGGMGEVYRARDSRLERSVALKVLRNETESSSEEWDHAVLRMQREAQAVAALSHPGIVAIYDIGEHESIPFIAMELVGGQPLRDLIGKDPQRTTNLRILLDVARALGAAHDAGFVHRDIKPENILVRQDGMAKILDFGIARKASLNGDRAGQTLDVQGTTIDAALVGMTAEGAIVGTPAYMSPEQLRGEVVDARADQFAWGVVAYELLSGRHPFHAEKGAIGLLSAILSEDPPPLEGLPAGVTDVVLRALEKDPEKRWASMQEIAKNWESFITNGDSRKLPVVAPQDGVVSPSQTANSSTNVRRPQARWVIAPMITLAALTAVVAFAFRKPAEVSVAPVAASSAMVAPPKPMTVTDQPIPVSTSPVAIAEFRQGLQYIRDAQWTAAARAFAHARNADPGMAAAHMRYSFIHYSYDITIAREAYRKAVGLRSTLTERDQGFLHALEPVMLRTPGDFREAAKRFESLVDRYPQDAELTFWLARALYYSDPNPAASERVVELNSRCTELDPQYADCWQMKAQGLVRLGKAEDAGKALNQCVQISENAVDCLIDAISYESTLGRCDAVVEMAKRLKAKDPNALHVGFILPEALYYTGADEPVVRAAFEEAEKQSREAGRIFEAEKALFMMAVSYGEFTKALDIANKMKTLRAPTAEAELELWLERAALYLELDRPLDAAKLAEEFLIASALHPQERSMKYLDPSIVMHSLRLHAGRLTTSEFQRLRSEWLAKQSPKGIAEEVIVWMYAYAFPAITPELAKDAVENISPKIVALSPQKQPLPKIFDSHYGKVLAKVGQHAQAIPRIEEALRVCTTNDTTMWTTQQRALLGYAYEATGDKPKACAQYQRVEALWGKSKQSRTVKEVNKRVKKLGCESTAGQGTP